MKRTPMRRILWPTVCAAPVMFLLSGCGVCDNTISQTVRSPDGQLKAVIFQRECGATTGFSTQISVLAADETLPDDSGNVFVESKGVSIEVVWQGSRHLIIKHKPTVFASAKQVAVDRGWLRSEIVMIDYAP